MPKLPPVSLASTTIEPGSAASTFVTSSRTRCGACVPVCPVEAIFYEDDVPDEWDEFTPINAEFFEDDHSGLGSPGGAAAVGTADVDHAKSDPSDVRVGPVHRNIEGSHGPSNAVSHLDGIGRRADIDHP